MFFDVKINLYPKSRAKSTTVAYKYQEQMKTRKNNGFRTYKKHPSTQRSHSRTGGAVPFDFKVTKMIECKLSGRLEDSYADILAYKTKGLPDLFCSPPPPQCFSPPVTNYMLLYSTLLCKKIARAPG